MRYIAFIGMLAIVLVALSSQFGSSEEVLKERSDDVTTVEKIEQPEWQTDEDAVKAAQDVINRKRTEAELKSVQGQIEALEATYKAEMKALIEQKTGLEKTLGTY